MLQVNLRPFLKRAAVVYVVGVGVAYVALRPNKADEKRDFSVPVTEDQRREIFDKNATHYDDDIGKHEKLAGIVDLRKELVKRCRGKVLEVGAGTGRNLEYYPAGSAVDLLDFSAEMLSIAKRRAQLMGYVVSANENQLGQQSTTIPPTATATTAANAVAAATATTVPQSSSAAPLARHARFVIGNASTGLPYADHSFDSVVDTFGLCSYEDPLFILQELQRVAKPGGQILLLEHGKSSWGWLSNILDRNTPGHVHKHGCYWNRDIEGLVNQAGLRVVEKRRQHAGTTYFIRAAA